MFWMCDHLISFSGSLVSEKFLSVFISDGKFDFFDKIPKLDKDQII